MIAFLKKYKTRLLVLLLSVVAVIGMIITKRRAEYHQGTETENELFFMLFQLLFIGVVVYLIGNWLFQIWKEYQLLKNEKLSAELENLKNQISPHFFFNTLNNLYGLIKKDPEKAQDFVLNLSDLMRHSIYSNDREKVNIEEEITYIENFIALHQIRHFKNVDIQFNKDIKNKNIKIHSLLLIILVENAFKHGIEKLVDNAFVHCNLIGDAHKLTFTVTNNFDTESQTNKKGVGLHNLTKRLSLLYPNKHQLQIQKEGTMYKSCLEIILS